MDKEQYIKVIDEYQDKISGSRKIKRFIHAAISGVDKDVINILGNKKCNNICCYNGFNDKIRLYYIL